MEPAAVGGGAASPMARSASPQLAPPSSWRNPTVLLGEHAGSSASSKSWRQLFRLGRTHAVRQDSEESIGERIELAPASTAASGGGPGARGHWQLMVALAALSVLICYADRSNISTAIIPMAEEYGWAASTQGLVLSAFFAGYLGTQLLGGALADAYGGKLVLAAGVAAWSACTVFTPSAASLGLPALIAMRVAMGLGEGVAFPAIHSLIARGVPFERQSTSVGVVTAASYAGTALAFGLAPTIIDQLGWPWVFYLFGVSAVLWLPIWLPFDFGSGAGSGRGRGGTRRFAIGDVWRELWGPRQATPGGAQAGLPGSEELAALDKRRALAPGKPLPVDEVPLVGQAQGEERGEDVLSDAGTEWSDGVAVGFRARQSQLGTGFGALMRTREVWAICVAQYTGSWGFYGLLNWLPSFFKDHYHVEIAQLASFTLLPYVVQGGVGAASGVLADKLIARGWPVRRVRRTMQTVGMIGPAVCMVAAASPLTDGSPSAASAWITVGLGLNALTLGGVSVSQLDVAPKHAGMVFAAGNTSATAAGLLAVPVTGLMLDITQSWPLVFAVTALHYVAGAATFYAWVGDKPLPEDG